jgi:hypothetical protein
MYGIGTAWGIWIVSVDHRLTSGVAGADGETGNLRHQVSTVCKIYLDIIKFFVIKLPILKVSLEYHENGWFPTKTGLQELLWID